jgi:hypothetical protein
MKAPLVTLTSEELLSLAPEIRTKWRDQLTPKRVPLDTITNAYDNPSIILSDPYESFLNSLGPDEPPPIFKVAKESHAIRSVLMNINRDPRQVEGLVDPGSSIIAVSEDVCHDLGLTYDPSIQLEMQSANGGVDLTLGLARNVPCDLGNITLYMQVHVVRNPAYDFLLGRPFDVLTTSVVRNYSDASQTITICDPNTPRSATVPTVPRGSHRRKISKPVFHN